MLKKRKWNCQNYLKAVKEEPSLNSSDHALELGKKRFSNFHNKQLISLSLSSVTCTVPMLTCIYSKRFCDWREKSKNLSAVYYASKEFYALKNTHKPLYF